MKINRTENINALSQLIGESLLEVKFTYSETEENTLVLLFSNGYTMRINEAFCRIRNDNLILSNWENSLGEEFRPMFWNRNQKNLLQKELERFNVDCVGITVVKVEYDDIGDVFLQMSNLIFVDIIVCSSNININHYSICKDDKVIARCYFAVSHDMAKCTT